MDLYRILSEKIEGAEIADLGPYSTSEEIKSNYRKLAQYYHPDKHANNPLIKLAEEKLKDINIAYQTLGDPAKRREYDEKYHAGSTPVRPRPIADKRGIIYRDVEPGSVIRESILIRNEGGPYTSVHIAKPFDQRIQVAETAGGTASPLRIDITLRADAYASVVEDAIRVYLDDEEVRIPIRLETKAAPAGAGKKTGGRVSGLWKGMGKGMRALIIGLGTLLIGLIVFIAILADMPGPDTFVPVKSMPSIADTEAPAKLPAKSPAASKAPSPTPTPSPSPSVITSPAIAFSDANLEKAIRREMDKPQGDITESDAMQVTSLNLHASNITDISALKYFKNLTKLELGDNTIRDIAPLKGLTNLDSLSLNNNPLGGLGALSGLQSLTRLQLQNAGLQDISALSPLTGLTELDLSDNQIKDISALSNLTGLESLMLRRNQIEDVSPLSGLTNLQVLFLGGNPISDYSPVQGLSIATKDF